MLKKALAGFSTPIDVRQLFRIAVALATLFSFAATPALAAKRDREQIKRAHTKKANKSSARASKTTSSRDAAKAAAPVVQAPPSTGISFSHNTLVDFSFTSGEPFINAAPVTVAPNTPAGSPFISVPFGVSTTVSLLWKSIDGGRSFIALGTPITRDAVTAPGGGDTHQDFDHVGRFYYSDLSAACVSTAVSSDGGNTFIQTNPLSCIGPADLTGVTDDRQWSGGFGDGRGYMTTRNFQSIPTIQNFHLNRTRDAGQTWLAPQTIGNVTQSGPLVMDKTKRNIGGTNYILGYQMYYSGSTLKMLRIQDPDTGANPTIVDLTIGTPGGAVSTVFPVPAVDNAGHLYVTWSNASAIFMATSTDRGASWSAAKRVTPLTGDAGTGTIIMPWAIAGDPGRVAVVWYRGSTPGNSTNVNNRWDIYMGQSLNALDPNPTWTYAKVNEHNIHFGEICLAGLNCDIAIPPGSRDRSFLEFPSITMDHRGAAMITWNDNTNQSAVTAANSQVTGAPYVMFSKQICGPSLLASVGDVAEPGTVAITAPGSGSVFNQGSPVTVSGTHTLPPGTYDKDESGDGRFPDHGPTIGSNVPALDLRQVDFTDTAANIIVKMQVADATTAGLTAATGTGGGDGLLYLTQWDYDESFANPVDKVFWVAAEIRAGVPVGRTGTLGVVRSATSKKFITYNPDLVDSASVTVNISNTAPGTITLTIPRNLVGSPPNGALLKSVTGYAMSERGPLAATPCPEPPASCENIFNPNSLPIKVDASGAFTYVVGGGLQLDGSVQLSLDDPNFTNPTTVPANLDGTWTHTFSNPSAGQHTVYVRQNSRGCATSSVESRTFIVQATNVRTNYALPANGGSASASSSHVSGLFPASGAINGDRVGNNWGTPNGGWNDGSRSAYPDVFEVSFASAKLIDEINVVTLQNNWHNAGEPTLLSSATGEGIIDFDVQYWNGQQWVTIPGGNITGNDKAWRQFMFAGVTTTKIRIVVNNSRNNWSRLVEVEAVGPGGQ